MIKILIAEDHKILGETLRRTFLSDIKTATYSFLRFDFIYNIEL
jgi:hypothetical protein